MKTIRAMLGLLYLAGCFPVGEGEVQGHAPQGYEERAILNLVNDLETDVELLAEGAFVHPSTAEQIIGHRDGEDRVYPSGDDNPFDDLAELDTIDGVGPRAIGLLLAYVIEQPMPLAEVIEGISFTAQQQGIVLWGVNQASFEELDVGVGLDRRAAERLVAGAPFSRIEEMGELGYVGPTALRALRDHTPAWDELRHAGQAEFAGTFDEVTFDEATALDALTIAASASRSELTRSGGLWTTAAQNVIFARPYTTLAEVADAPGVGPATLRKLKAMAESGNWTAGSETP